MLVIRKCYSLKLGTTGLICASHNCYMLGFFVCFVWGFFFYSPAADYITDWFWDYVLLTVYLQYKTPGTLFKKAWIIIHLKPTLWWQDVKNGSAWPIIIDSGAEDSIMQAHGEDKEICNSSATQLKWKPAEGCETTKGIA